MPKSLPTLCGLLIAILYHFNGRGPPEAEKQPTPKMIKNSPKITTILAPASEMAKDGGGVPSNCQITSSDAQSATCSSGYYKAVHKDSPGTNLCCACSNSINHCLQCSSSSLGIDKDVTCQKCSFSHLPSGDFKSCELRGFFFIYLSLYTTVTIILGILTCLEKRKMNSKNLDIQAYFNKADCSFDAESSEESIEVNEGNHNLLYKLLALFLGISPIFHLFIFLG